MRLPSWLLVCLLFVSATSAAVKTNSFEKEIVAFEAQDRTNPPPPEAALFVGSSSIRMWKTLAQDLPDFRVINRGFGGSQIADSIHFAERIVLPYRPRVIVLYAGGNDLNAGKSAEKVFADYRTFVETVRAKLPETHIAFISVAGNPARWSQAGRVRELNSLVREHALKHSGLSFIDVYSEMLGADGLPKPDIFVADRLHMNAKGYAIWTELVGRHLRTLAGGGYPSIRR